MNFFLWTGEIVAHLAEHDVTPGDFEFVLDNPSKKGTSDSSGRPCVWGYTEHGRHLIAVYQRLDDLTVLPVTAHKVLKRKQGFTTPGRDDDVLQFAQKVQRRTFSTLAIVYNG
jgi:hypothetical protein